VNRFFIVRPFRLRHILAELRMPGALGALDAILQGVGSAH